MLCTAIAKRSIMRGWLKTHQTSLPALLNLFEKVDGKSLAACGLKPTSTCHQARACFASLRRDNVHSASGSASPARVHSCQTTSDTPAHCPKLFRTASAIGSLRKNSAGMKQISFRTTLFGGKASTAHKSLLTSAQLIPTTQS